MKIRNLKIAENKLLILSLTVLIIICVLVFNVVYFSTYYGIAQIDYINSLLLVPFIILIFSFGIFMEQQKRKTKRKRIDRYNLTDKEKVVVKLIVDKKKNQAIADELFVELSTIKTHINNIYKKLDVKNRTELIKKIDD